MTLTPYNQSVEPQTLSVAEGSFEFPKSPLTMEEYEKLKTALSQIPKRGYFYMLLAQALFSTGLRIGEMLKITPSHFRFMGGGASISVVRGKQEKPTEELIPYSKSPPGACSRFSTRPD